MSLVPFCGWRAPHRAAVEDTARNRGDSLGLTAAHPGGDHSQMPVQSHTPSTCSRPSPSRVLHGEHLHSRRCTEISPLQSPGSSQGQSQAIRQKAKPTRRQLPGQGARPGASRGEGWRAPPRWILTDGPCFTAAGTRVDVENLNCLPGQIRYLWAGGPSHSCPELQSP